MEKILQTQMHTHTQRKNYPNMHEDKHTHTHSHTNYISWQQEEQCSTGSSIFINKSQLRMTNNRTEQQ